MERTIWNVEGVDVGRLLFVGLKRQQLSKGVRNIEDDWHERADCQREVERDGQEIHLCFGTHTHADSVILPLNWVEFQNEFKDTPFTQDQFMRLKELLKNFYLGKKDLDKYHQKDARKYKIACAFIESIAQELELFCAGLPQEQNEEVAQ